MYVSFIYHVISTEDDFVSFKGNAPRLNLNLYLNSLLVKRQIDNPSPGDLTGRKSVPSSHKGDELRRTIIRQFRGRK